MDDLKPYWAKEDFPINKDGEVSPQLEKIWHKMTQEIHDLCEGEAYSVFNAYIALFEKVISGFGQLSRRDDVLFLEELNRKASLLFEEDLVTVEELYFRLAARFQHYLIDEFQDTSVSQWRNLALMVEEALSQGGSLFYVGDKKQAIYSFRGGESQLFDALQVQLSKFNLETMALDKNYRSAPAIINFNNRVFGLENLEDFLQRRREDFQENKRHDVDFTESDFQQIANAFKHARQLQGTDLTGGVVCVRNLDAQLKLERSHELRQKLIALVRELQGRFALKDIAILTRGNQEVEEITQWLLQERIYVSSDRSSDIKNNPLIGELINLLTFISSPIDNNAFAQFCLGELMPKASGLGTQVLRKFLFDCAQLKKSQEMYYYKFFKETFPQVWKTYFEDFLYQAGVYPLYELTAGIIKRYGREEHFSHYQGFFMHLLELIKKGKPKVVI